MPNELDLAREEIRELTASVIEPRNGEPFALYVFANDEIGADTARYVERVVFEETFGNTPALLASEYGGYEASSLFFVVFDQRRCLPAGMSRLILPSEAGLKSLDDLPRDWGQSADEVWDRAGLPFESRLIWDCATIATGAEYRRGALFGLVGMALYHGIAVMWQRLGFRWLVAIVDAPVLRVLQWRLGRLFEPYSGVPPLPYLGSASSVPVRGDLVTWEARLAAHQPEIYEVVFGGRGLEPALSIPDWDPVEARVRDRMRAVLAREEPTTRRRARGAPA